MATNNKISNLISTQVPDFIKNDYQTFIDFIEAYYEFMEQSGEVVDMEKNLLNYIDIDKTVASFAERLYTEFLDMLPKNGSVDKNFLIKHIQDFYKAKGTQKALKFLMRILFNQESTVYFPKNDILRASDGKWYIQKSLRVTGLTIDNIATNIQTDFARFINHKITGGTTGSTATVERTDRYFESGTQIDELILSSINGTFNNGEMISTTDQGSTLKANIFSGIVSSITINSGGTQYKIGDPVIFQSSSGSGANAVVSAVTSGNIGSIYIINTGAGFLANDNMLFSGGGGAGSNAYANTVNVSQYYHPNTYNLIISLISYEANTVLSNAVYSNLSAANVNTTIANAMSYFIYGPTGPVETITIRSLGTGYTSPPTVALSANTRARELGILGRMSIVSPGLNYVVNNVIQFRSTRGYGANAVVSAVAGNGAITKVSFVANGPFVIGGYDYDPLALPTTNVVTTTGSGANVVVTTILGGGDIYGITTDSIGVITGVTLVNRGSGYSTTPTLNLTASGDGTANLTAAIINGVFTYPGRYLNQDGMLSSSKFLEDRDYYQNFSYVLKVAQSFVNYISSIKNLTHPSGLKIFAEYPYITGFGEAGANSTIDQPTRVVFNPGTYVYNNVANLIVITEVAHGISSNTKVYLEFDSGDTANVTNGRYNVVSTTANTFNISHSGNANTSGIVLVGQIVT